MKIKPKQTKHILSLSKFTLYQILSIDELFVCLKIGEFFFIWGKIKWLFVTYDMFQKMFLQQGTQLPADAAFFFSPSNKRHCFIFLLFWKFCDNSQTYKSDIHSHSCSLLCYSRKLPMERLSFSIWLSDPLFWHFLLQYL